MSDAPPLNILVAYPYARPIVLEEIGKLGPSARLLIDSGAYTAWRAGQTIPLLEYCRFLEETPVRPWRYFTLDVIGQPEPTLRQYEAMLERGLSPIPIFTRGDDPKRLEEFYRTSDVVGMGGVVQTPGALGFVNAFHRLCAGRKAHWLGFAEPEYLRRYRPYMCDSSTWRTLRWGRVIVYLGQGRFHMLQRRQCAQPLPPPLASRIRLLGFDPLDLARESAWHGHRSPQGALVERLSCVSMVEASLDIERNLGTKFFLAAGNRSQVRMLIRAYAARTSRVKGPTSHE